MKHFWTKGDGDTVTPLWHQCPSTFSLWSLREVKNLETGASELYHPQVLLRNGEATWLEPLSRHWFHPAPKYPGKVQWLPPTAGPPNFEGSEALRKWKTYEKDKRWNIWHVGARTQLGESWQLDMIVTNLVFQQKFVLNGFGFGAPTLKWPVRRSSTSGLCRAPSIVISLVWSTHQRGR